MSFEDKIEKEYLKLYKQKGYIPATACDLEYKLWLLFTNPRFKRQKTIVRKYLMNQVIKTRDNAPKQFLRDQGLRSKIEGGFGVEKKHSPFKTIEFRGLKSWQALIYTRNLRDLILSAFWADKGRRRNLTSSFELVI